MNIAMLLYAAIEELKKTESSASIICINLSLKTNISPLKTISYLLYKTRFKHKLSEP